MWLKSVLVIASIATVRCNLSQGITEMALQQAASLEFKSDILGKNFVWSPYSAHSAFSQVLLGAQGVTRSELESVLGIKKEDTSEYGALRSSVKSGNSTLKIANLMAVTDGFKPKTKFTSDLQQRFGSEIVELDFARDPVGSVNKINKFVADQTNNKIEELLTEDNVDPLTRMILVNAVYFKALWQTAFDPKNTFDSEFNTTTGPVQTKFMTLDMKARILETDTFRMLELPYQDEGKSLLVILPNGEGESIMDLIRTTNFSSIRDQRMRQTKVLLPKFKIKARTMLKEVMKEAGARRMFNQNAELGGISDEELYVTDAIQEAFIEVSEEGTEAAAATGIILGLRIGIQRTQFVVDRPFGFVVYDFNQNVPLFMGKVNNPSNEIGVRRGGGSVTTTQQPTASSTANTANINNNNKQNDCRRQRDNIPNALNNVQLCKQATDGKLFDWLRTYRTVCEESTRVSTNFEENNCKADWCQFARSKVPEWNKMSSDCKRRGRQLDSCRTNDNRIKAYETLCSSQ